jgi:hypothetical protein
MDEDARMMAGSSEVPGGRGRPWLLAVGAVIIVGMLLIAAFSLGVYVGEHGWTRQGLTLQGPGAQPGPQPGADRPPQVGPDAPPPLPGGGRPPDLVGGIRRVMEGTLLMATSDGPRTVELDEATQVETHEGDPRSLDDLQRGQGVAIFGYRGGDGRALVAELVVLLPAPEKPRAEPGGG